MTEDSQPRRLPRLLVAIIAFKFFKAVLFLGAGAALMFARQEPASRLVLHWADWVEGTPRLGFTAQILRDVSDQFALHFSGIVASCLFAGIVVACEGIFLSRGYTWAPWLTIVLTALFIPLELQHLIHRPSWHQILLLIVNILIVIYLYNHRRFFKRHLESG